MACPLVHYIHVLCRVMKVTRAQLRSIPGTTVILTVCLYWIYLMRLEAPDFPVYQQRTSQLIWRNTFPYLTSPLSNADHVTKLVILVTTRPESSSRRDIIRKTWLAEFRKDPRIGVIFVSGISSSNRSCLLDDVRTEANIHGDLLTVDFEDSYFNLSLKTYLAFAYALRQYKDVEYILKVDDDVVLFTGNIINYLTKINSSAKAFYCYEHVGSRPYRRIRMQKYYVPHEVYAKNVYPPFCSGHAYLASRAAIEEVVRYAGDKLEYYFHLEDVLFTGIVAEKCNVARVHSSNWHPLTGYLWTIGDAFSIHWVKNNGAMMEQWNRYLKP